MGNGYFTTAEAEKAKNWEIFQQYRECKARISRLENELKLIANGWKEMAAFFYDCHFNTFAVDDARIRVIRPDRSSGQRPNTNEVFSLPFSFVNADSLRVLLGDLEDTKKLLADLGEQLKPFGIIDAA